MNLTEKEKKKMISACLKNERGAHEFMYKTFHSEMIRVCYLYLADKSLAKEAMNMGFLKVFQSMPAFDTAKGELGGWIRRIMINTSIDLSRKEMKFRNIPNYDQEDEGYFIQPIILERLYAEDLFSAIATLPLATQTVFNLSVIDGFSHQEIGDKLNISEGTSRWHLSEAKRKLRALIDQSGNLIQLPKESKVKNS